MDKDIPRETGVQGLFSAIVLGTDYSPRGRIPSRLREALERHCPDDFEESLRAIGTRFLSGQTTDPDAVVEEVYALWSERIINLDGPKKRLARTQFTIDRYTFRQLLYEFCSEGNQVACSRLRAFDSRWRELIGTRGITAEDIRKIQSEKLDPLNVRRLDGEIYPILEDQIGTEEIKRLFRSYVFHEPYVSSAYEITMGLYRMLNSDATRNVQVLQVVRRWLEVPFERSDQIVLEAFDFWKSIFDNHDASDEGELQFLGRVLQLYEASGNSLAANKRKELDLIRLEYRRSENLRNWQ
jgi:hypothetical protein